MRAGNAGAFVGGCLQGAAAEDGDDLSRRTCSRTRDWEKLNVSARFSVEKSRSRYEVRGLTRELAGARAFAAGLREANELNVIGAHQRTAPSTMNASSDTPPAGEGA